MLLCVSARVCVSQLGRSISRVCIFVAPKMGLFRGQAEVQAQRSRSRLSGASESRMNLKLMGRHAKWAVVRLWRLCICAVAGRRGKNGGGKAERSGSERSVTIKRWSKRCKCTWRSAENDASPPRRPPNGSWRLIECPQLVLFV